VVFYHDCGCALEFRSRRLNPENAGAAPDERVFWFGPFYLRPSAHLLLEGETPIHIGARALDLLIVLVENADRVVTKDELFARVWPRLVVYEGNLKTQVALLRKALRDGQGGARYLLTVPGRGYRFVAPLSTTGTSTLINPRDPIESVSGLPARLTRLIGRANAIRDILGRLDRHRFVTIVGPGGIGKTSVGVAVAEQAAISYHDGVFLVDCGPLLGTSLVSQKLAATLGLDVAADDPTRGLSAYLRDKRALIVLDCCERVVEAVAVLVENLLKGAAGIGILATSREPLRAEGESVYRLDPLEIPPASLDLTASEALTYPAVELFVERVKSSGGPFELRDSDAPVVADICRRLDGIALAIELAAGRVEVFGLLGVAARLEDRVRLLTHGRRTALPRHQTLTATLDWSYDAITEPERAVLRRLSVFAGGFTLEAAQAVATDALVDSSDVADIVESLISKSLLNADVATAIGHYRPLDITRAYSLQKLVESGEFFQTARRHAGYIHSLLEVASANASALSSSTGAAVRLTADSKLIDEARAAIDWAFSSGGDIEYGVMLTVASIPLWAHLSLNGECLRYVQQALLAGNSIFGQRDRREMQLLAALGTALVWTKGPGPEADTAFAEALKLAESLNDADYQIRVLWGQWSSHFNSGRIRLSLDTAKRFRDVSADHGDIAAALVGERTIGMSLFYLGDHTGARRHTELLLARYVRPKDRSHIMRFQFDARIVARTLRSKLLWAQGFPDQAMNEVEGLIDEAITVGHAMSLALALAQGACPVTLLCGDWIAAERFINLLLKHTVEHALDLWHDWGVCFAAMLLISRGNVDEGLQALNEALNELPLDAFFARFAGARATLAEALGRVGAISSGHATIDEALMRSEQQGERWYIAEFLRIKGELLQLEDTPGARQQAEEHFRRSLDCARRQEAPSWELRTSLSLARLYQGQGHHIAACDALQPVYSRFQEGFGTADLKAAKALISELT
jgi:predicted ATPase/DNA-binding winged helix-turn-helix (wHTH) protein